jgi:leader peptidase (prepilin peptidase) / N-methyltransferase
MNSVKWMEGAPPIAVDVAIAVLGAMVGRFVNLVINCVPRVESRVSPGSRCSGCSAGIAPSDRLPGLACAVLRWRCRRCRAPISPRYPLVELLTSAGFAAVAAVRGVHPELVLLLPFVAVLIAVAGIDLGHRIIPNRIVLPAAIFALGASALVRADMVPQLAIAGGLAFLALLLANLAYPAGLGMGDVKLAGVMGLYLGLSVAPAMLVAFLAGTLVGVVRIAREGRAARKSAIPFGPFLALGGLIGVLAGPELVHAYHQHFLA